MLSTKDGKGLSENDYTTEEKNKLAGMEKYVEDKIQQHNTGTSVHADIRKLISELTNRLNTLVDSDDTSIDTVFLTTSLEYAYLSSSTVKEVAAYGGDISNFVTPYVADEVHKRLRERQGGQV